MTWYRWILQQCFFASEIPDQIDWETYRGEDSKRKPEGEVKVLVQANNKTQNRQEAEDEHAGEKDETAFLGCRQEVGMPPNPISNQDDGDNDEEAKGLEVEFESRKCQFGNFRHNQHPEFSFRARFISGETNLI